VFTPEKATGSCELDADYSLLALLRRQADEIFTEKKYNQTFEDAMGCAVGCDDVEMIRQIPGSRRQAAERWVEHMVLRVLEHWQQDILGDLDISEEPWASWPTQGGRAYLPLRTCWSLFELWRDKKAAEAARKLFERAGMAVPDMEIHHKKGRGMARQEFANLL
jgi:hypothetical protein